MSTFFLPFDHRSGFARDIMNVPYPFSSQDREFAKHLKTIIYQAFLESVKNTASTRDTFGILIDEETGEEILRDAHDRGILTALTLEKSGSQNFSLLYDTASAERVTTLHANLGKMLVHVPEYRPEESLSWNAFLHALHDCDLHGVRCMAEIISPVPEEEREGLITRLIINAQDRGIRPAFWKLEALPSQEAWKRLRDITDSQSGLLLLGRGERAQKLEQALSVAAPDTFAPVDGFAIGRTVFADALRDYVKKRISQQETIFRISTRFLRYQSLWNQHMKIPS